MTTKNLITTIIVVALVISFYYACNHEKTETVDVTTTDSICNDTAAVVKNSIKDSVMVKDSIVAKPVVK